MKTSSKYITREDLNNFSPNLLAITFNTIIILLLISFVLLLISVIVILSTGFGTNMFCGGFLSILPFCFLSRLLIPDLLRVSEVNCNNCNGGRCIDNRCHKEGGIPCLSDTNCDITAGGRCRSGQCFYPFKQSCTFGWECASGHTCFNGVCAKTGEDPRTSQRINNQFCVLGPDCYATTPTIILNNTVSLDLIRSIEISRSRSFPEASTSASSSSVGTSASASDSVSTSASASDSMGTSGSASANVGPPLGFIFSFFDCENGRCARGQSKNIGPFLIPLIVGYNVEINEFNFSKFSSKVWFYIIIIGFIVMIVSYIIILSGRTRLGLGLYILSIVLIIIGLIIRSFS